MVLHSPQAWFWLLKKKERKEKQTKQINQQKITQQFGNICQLTSNQVIYLKLFSLFYWLLTLFQMLLTSQAAVASKTQES